MSNNRKWRLSKGASTNDSYQSIENSNYGLAKLPQSGIPETRDKIHRGCLSIENSFAFTLIDVFVGFCGEQLALVWVYSVILLYGNGYFNLGVLHGFHLSIKIMIKLPNKERENHTSPCYSFAIHWLIIWELVQYLHYYCNVFLFCFLFFESRFDYGCERLKFRLWLIWSWRLDDYSQSYITKNSG